MYTSLDGSTTPEIQYISTLIIKADKVFYFYGNGVQVADVTYEYERLKQGLDIFHLEQKASKALEGKEKLSLPAMPKIRLSGKISKRKNTEVSEDS